MSCNHDHGCCCQNKSSEKDFMLSEKEVAFLLDLAQTPFLPLARFVLKSSKSNHLESVALAPVYLNDKADTMVSVKETGEILKSLAEKGLITLDYDEPLQNGNYAAYTDSLLYSYFAETVSEGCKRDEFLFDIPQLELGSIALTYLGQISIKNLENISQV